jgi:hypothetical protein
MVATVDLSQEWPKIENELHDLLDDCAGAAALQGEETGQDAKRKRLLTLQ